MQVQYLSSIAINTTDPTRLVPVRIERDIEDRVKECEVLTGKPGRRFVIVGAERLLYHVEWTAAGLCVRRQFDDGAHGSPQFVPSADVSAHALGHALACGQLFTLSVH